ncbi:prolipoprotein diacylglyceryl transferase Lgt [Thermoclostridium stercorarium subsp. stercorarium DSM 8532]|uniref:Phosphatidylglycerol--prolipoprotein diacylglyceryl transferase n=3 Tax=Thermoclostridium stercorarium TaxID=1510 RepID=L7VQT4_THES1|nr:prolipoprotein diacylglyceryl transferase [Thermoclostridium stercorarium]AGC69152.1 prolipoprotein diacylglyceryl transferase Lgt [Thermoclostridium stercorarium subsp. stercorarium DSM 8532]AGI40121.1 prolipoprotein diacylglyceryl transferase [Thermoclostridium stercorarium subsp. stercorarium DSM 8532]ANW99434.1 prolipoprotein diacylglyceryl transferase [Thermoclostridium stercorarium subsp. thermolacticum DSM 2910]ANX02060.1 prolipoprotein diacylglyceryl transferase [Thermoclostridium st
MHYISFPKLGIEINLDPVAFSVGPINIYWYGIITALAFLVIIIGVLRNSEKYGLKQDDLIDLILITTPVGIICARIFYVLVNWGYYKNNLSEVYKIWHGGLAIYGGVIGGIFTIYLFCRIRRINTLKLLDHIVVYLVLGQVIGRWGNFVNQELFGPNTDLPWGMTGDIIKSTVAGSPSQFPGVDPELPVHPLFLYESLWNLVAFFVLLWFRKRKKLDGEVFSLYMISYGLARFVIDSLRFDLKIGNVNVNRVIGFLFAVTFIIVFTVRRVRLKNGVADEEYQPSVYRQIIAEIEDKSPENDLSPDDQTEISDKESEPSDSDIPITGDDTASSGDSGAENNENSGSGGEE